MTKKLLSIVLILCLSSTLAFADNALLEKGDEYLIINDSEHAFSAYELAIADSPNNPEVLLHVARAYQSAGDKERALSIVEQALANCPTLGEAYLLRMQLKMKSNPDESYQDMIRAEVLDTTPAASDYAGLAVELYRSGNAKLALKLFTLSGEIAHSDVYKAAYANALYSTGNTEEAMSIIGDQSYADPQMALVVASRGLLRLRETSVFDPNKSYILIIPAHAAKNEEFSSINEIERMGGVKQSDGSYHVPMTQELINV